MIEIRFVLGKISKKIRGVFKTKKFGAFSKLHYIKSLVLESKTCILRFFFYRNCMISIPSAQNFFFFVYDGTPTFIRKQKKNLKFDHTFLKFFMYDFL